MNSNIIRITTVASALFLGACGLAIEPDCTSPREQESWKVLGGRFDVQEPHLWAVLMPDSTIFDSITLKGGSDSIQLQMNRRTYAVHLDIKSRTDTSSLWSVTDLRYVGSTDAKPWPFYLADSATVHISPNWIVVDYTPTYCHETPASTDGDDDSHSFDWD